ncbi:HlyD family efflux transporter periplasmic adaptor subunit [Hellea sp.]|nr:HlyD family efflux transporter periplasmic adaptor subunit [Hellea sp.]
MFVRYSLFSIILILTFFVSLPSGAADISLPQAKTAPEITARGVLRARETAHISAPLSARLLKMAYKSGQYVANGALLATFDCRAEEAEFTALTQKYEVTRLKHEKVGELRKYGAAGELELALAKSDMEYAKAQANIVEVRLKDCAVYAPFSGYITARHHSAFETPQAGNPLYTLQRAGRPELSVIAPAAWTDWLESGHMLSFRIDETGETFEAKVIRLGITVDPISQTFEIIAQPTKTPKARVGMSGVARFKAPS